MTKLETISINKYRTVEDIKLEIPQGKTLVLFRPNNAGKSNILSAIDRIIGEHIQHILKCLKAITSRETRMVTLLLRLQLSSLSLFLMKIAEYDMMLLL
jgi:predicted ATP-binding protein involved in virulence